MMPFCNLELRKVSFPKTTTSLSEPSNVDVVAKAIRLLKEERSWGYHFTGPFATEPTALACLALTAHGEHHVAAPLAESLVEIQTVLGSVGVTRELEMPAWTTSLACLAWLAVDQTQGNNRFSVPCQRGLEWLLSVQGRTIPKNPQIGHDPTILGWSWAADTHSWMEPTCLAVLALKALGEESHSRTREGVRMIVDRLLEDGGCNFGSTVILGQATLPQTQASGLAMLALANEGSEDPRIERTLDYLENEIDEDCSTASLCFALTGLTAHGRRAHHAEDLLEQVFQRELRGETSCYKIALILLASCRDLRWLPSENLSVELALASAI